MTQEFQNTINAIQNQLADIDLADLIILHASVYHSTSIILHIKGDKDLFLLCNYCSFFRGNTTIWKDVKLTLEIITKPLGNPVHKRTESVLKLSDNKNPYFIECKNIQIINADEAYSWNTSGSETETISKRLLPLNNFILEKWPKGRANLVNSDFFTLTLVIDLETHEQLTNLSNVSDWYKSNTEDRLEIYIHQPDFLSISFIAWEFSGKLTLSSTKNNLILRDENSTFEIEAKFITAQEITTGNQ